MLLSVEYLENYGAVSNDDLHEKQDSCRYETDVADLRGNELNFRLVCGYVTSVPSSWCKKELVGFFVDCREVNILNFIREAGADPEGRGGGSPGARASLPLLKLVMKKMVVTCGGLYFMFVPLSPLTILDPPLRGEVKL